MTDEAKSELDERDAEMGQMVGELKSMPGAEELLSDNRFFSIASGKHLFMALLTEQYVCDYQARLALGRRSTKR